MIVSPLLTILRASHCPSTHHYFAIDSLPMVQTDAGIRLRRLLLRHHDRFLAGAMDPDLRFRDFQNHVIHVNDGYWGGAPRVAHRWYDRMQRYLRTDRFGDAAHAAGVLSHYFTDVMQPLHTAVCDRERVYHRPLECRIAESYDTIFRCWKEDEMRVVFQLSNRAEWLGEAMLHGARFASQKRELLLDSGAVEGEVIRPAGGFDHRTRTALSELFGLAITGLARVLERAASDAEAARGTPLPRAPLLLPTLLAGIDAPLQRSIGWFVARERRAEADAIIDEFKRTGTLSEHLPPEVDITHRVVKIFHDERRWKQERIERLRSKIPDRDGAPMETQIGVERLSEDDEARSSTIPFPDAADFPRVATPIRRSA